MKIRNHVLPEFLLVIFLFLASPLFAPGQPEASAEGPRSGPGPDGSAKTMAIAFEGAAPALGRLPSTEVYFSPETDILHLFHQKIGLAKESLEVAVSSIDLGELAQALVEAGDRGVRVRLILDEGYVQENPAIARFLTGEGLEVRLLRGKAGGRMNNNFAIIDNRELLTGSYNWTERSQRFNLESVLFTDEPDVVAAYRKEFERLVGLTEEVSKKVISRPLLPKMPPREEKEEGPPPPKEFLSISFQELEKVLGEESPLGSSEKRRVWEDYRGKYVQWQGVVMYRGVGRMDWNRVGISHSQGKEVDVEVSFNWSNMEDVLALREGDFVTYVARLSKRRGYGAPYRLEDGELLKQK